MLMFKKLSGILNSCGFGCDCSIILVAVQVKDTGPWAMIS